MNLSILYLGKNHGTSRHRADALRRLGHKVELIDPWAFFPEFTFIKKVIGKLAYEIGPAWLEPFTYRRLVAAISNKQFDVIWNNQCEVIGPKTVQFLKKHTTYLITYINDDPFGPRDKRRFSLYKQSVRHYNLIVVVREPNIVEAYSHGAQRVLRIPFTADEIAHAPLNMHPDEKAKFSSDVAFIGTWMPERGSFIARLLQLGVPVSIYGDRWQKAKEWRQLKRVWKGPGLIEQGYTKAIQSAKICLGLLSKGNRDLLTRRSVEVPFCNCVLCAERTEDHLKMYKEDEEAVFWNTPEECAAKCLELLNDEPKRRRIAEAGHRRCHASGCFNEPVMEGILNVLLNRNPKEFESRLSKIP